MLNRYTKASLNMSLVALFLDQITKFYALKYLSKGEIIHVAPSFNLLLAWNKGVSFSLFNSGEQLTITLLSLVALGVIITLIIWSFKSTDIKLNIALGCIIGGAIGNLIDRVRFGAVVDFLDVYWQTHHWPTFNIADSFICFGVGLILITSFGKK